MRYFITGTDTGVGKTYVLTLILKFLRHKGFNVFAMKPIETGCGEINRMLIPSDGYKIAQALNKLDSLDEICPIRFKSSLAPYSAEKIEKKGIDLKIIKEILKKRDETIIFLEGAGGLLVPIFNNYFMIDLARDFSDSIILVSSLRLGTINHTLLSVEAIKKRGIKISGIILNENDNENDEAKKTNLDIIKELCSERVLGVIPYNFSKYEDLDKFLELDFMPGL